ncbi:MAG TPA: hypothetical protein VHG52_15445, partial [Thermomicrobiales bacterium]|nr:hypothetical protein [Thermomicrobiales bacterium]
DGIAAIGSGAPYATAAAKALLTHSDLDAAAIVEAAMTITADLCIFTNHRFSIEAFSRGEELEPGDTDEADDELSIDGPVPAPDPGTNHDDEDDDDDDDDDQDDDDDEQPASDEEEG